MEKTNGGFFVTRSDIRERPDEQPSVTGNPIQQIFIFIHAILFPRSLGSTSQIRCAASVTNNAPIYDKSKGIFQALPKYTKRGMADVWAVKDGKVSLSR